MKSGEFILKNRWLIIALSVIIPVIIGLQIFRAEIDPDLEKYIPANMQSRINTQEIENIFGGDELLILAFETKDVLNPQTLKRIKDIRKELVKLDEVDQVMSLFDISNFKNDQGTLLSEPFIERIPQNREEIEKIRNDLSESKMAKGIVVSEDFSLTAIILSLNNEVEDNDIVSKVENIIHDNPGDEKVYLGGLPYMKTVISGDIARDMKRLMIIGLVIMLVMLYVFFRDIRGVILPFSVVILSIIFSLGLLPLIGWKMSIITLLLPILLIAIANNYGIHLIARYQEINWSDEAVSKKELVKELYTGLKIPIFLTGITTIAGMLSLLSHKIIPARQLGIISAVGISFALIISLFFIPAILTFLRKPTVSRSKKNGDKRFLDKVLDRIALTITAKPLRILIIATCIVMISGGGIFLLKTDTNLEKFFPGNHPVRQSSEIINKVFGGAQNLAVHINGDIMDPLVMKKIDNYTEYLKQFPGVGNVLSISSVIREISKAMNNPGDELYDKIPSDREAIAQYLLLYSMNGNPEDLEKLIDFNYENAQIIIRINNGNNAVIKKIINEVKKITAGDYNVKRIGGYGYVVTQLADMVIKGQVSSLLVAFIIVAIILAVAFRSVSAGLTSSIPLVISLVLLFGLMGFFGIYLDVATALLSSIMIGAGIDYTIHFLWRYRQERMQGLMAKEAVVKTLTTTGRGITFNALSVIVGFCALPFSSFAPIRFFGFLVIISIFTCLVGALVIVPSIVLVTKPRFLETEDSRLKSAPARWPNPTDINDRLLQLTVKQSRQQSHQLNPNDINDRQLQLTGKQDRQQSHKLNPTDTNDRQL